MSVELRHLRIRLDDGLPPELPAGSSTSLFLTGVCFHEEVSLASLSLTVDGREHPVTVHSAPRIDVDEEDLHRPQIWGSQPVGASQASAFAYRSGFWGTIPVTMPAAGSVAVGARITLAGGETTVAELGRIEVAAGREPRPASGDGAAIAICMATYNPVPELLRAQIESIRGQTREDWICVISDDGSRPELLAAIEEAIAPDPRFRLSRSPRRLGFYRNFERCLGLVPDDVGLVALSDQDDRWDPEKLEVLAEGLGDRMLVYSDQRLVSDDGEELAASFWSGPRANNYENLASLLIANTVTGAASLMRRELVELALPFPETPGVQYHDHWLALLACATGGIAYVDRPLYDYVQHGGAFIGHEGSNQGSIASPAAAGGLLTRIRNAGAGSRVSYFFAYCRLRVLAETMLLRAGGRMRRADRSMLRRFVGAERSPAALLWLQLRRLRARRGHTETLDAERILLLGIAWRYAIQLLGRIRGRPFPGVTYDSRLPPSPSHEGGVIDHAFTRSLADHIKPIEWEVSGREPERVNLLVPTIDLRHLFGGYIAKFNLARRLADEGFRVRLLTVDRTPPLPAGWRAEVESYAGLDGLFERIEIGFARDLDSPVRINPRDAMIATTWWTASIAAQALRGLERERFLYLIQEFEPFTHAMGSWSAAAQSTYGLPHHALFSTDFLREYFAANGFGVYAEGREEGDRRSASFQNAITAVSPPTLEEMSERSRRRLLFYARPEPHGSRNMFELGLLALREAVAIGVLGPAWDLVGIGSTDASDREVDVGSGRTLTLMSRRGQGDYGALLAGHDVGLSLMYTPHPSLVPLEMASAGMVTVTNGYATKTAAMLSAISENLITARPDIDGIVDGLAEAVRRSGDFEARLANSHLDWSRDWERSFDGPTMARIGELLRGT